MNDTLIRLSGFFDKYKYNANIINIYDICIKKIYKRLSMNNYLLRVPNTLYYCLVYNQTYFIEFIGKNSIKIPLMVGSKFDISNTDFGGYFVIDGKKKVIV